MHTDYALMKFFTPEQLKAVYYYIGQLEFVEGVDTFNIDEELGRDHYYKYKKNWEYPVPANVILDFFKDSTLPTVMAEYAYPEKIFNGTASIIRKNGYFRAHNGPVVGDHVTHIMLTPPEDYEGGNYCVLIDGEVKKFKLDAGAGITHYAGLSVEEEEVTKGVKMTLSFVTQSKIRRKTDRDKITRLKWELGRYAGATLPTFKSLEDFKHYDLLNKLAEVRNIEREYVDPDSDT